MKIIPLNDLIIESSTGATNALYSLEKKDGLIAKKMLTGVAITKLGEIDASLVNEAWLAPEKDISRFHLKEGDVVVLAKGSSIRSAYVTKELAKLEIFASANFLIIRTNPELLLGQALVAFLNSKSGKMALENASMGSSIKNVSKVAFGNIEMLLPSLEQQQNIASLFSSKNQAYLDAINLANQQLIVSDACMEQLLQGESQ